MGLEKLIVLKLQNSTDKSEYSHIVNRHEYIDKLNSMLQEIPDEIYETSIGQLICFGVLTKISCNTSLSEPALQDTSVINIHPIGKNIFTPITQNTTIEITLDDSSIFETNIELVTNNFMTIRLRDQLPQNISKGNDVSFKINNIDDYTHKVNWSTSNESLFISQSGYMITMPVSSDTTVSIICSYGTTTFDKEILVKNRT